MTTQLADQLKGLAGIMTADDFRYLGKLVDWAAGEGFCQIEGMEDPDEFAFKLWERTGLDGADYSAEALGELVAIQAMGDAA